MRPVPEKKEKSESSKPVTIVIAFDPSKVPTDETYQVDGTIDLIEIDNGCRFVILAESPGLNENRAAEVFAQWLEAKAKDVRRAAAERRHIEILGRLSGAGGAEQVYATV